MSLSMVLLPWLKNILRGTPFTISTCGRPLLLSIYIYIYIYRAFLGRYGMWLRGSASFIQEKHVYQPSSITVNSPCISIHATPLFFPHLHPHPPLFNLHGNQPTIPLWKLLLQPSPFLRCWILHRIWPQAHVDALEHQRPGGRDFDLLVGLGFTSSPISLIRFNQIIAFSE